MGRRKVKLMQLWRFSKIQICKCQQASSETADKQFNEQVEVVLYLYILRREEEEFRV